MQKVNITIDSIKIKRIEIEFDKSEAVNEVEVSYSLLSGDEEITSKMASTKKLYYRERIIITVEPKEYDSMYKLAEALEERIKDKIIHGQNLLK